MTLKNCLGILFLGICLAACKDVPESPNGKIGLEYRDASSGQPSFTVSYSDEAGDVRKVLEILHIGVECSRLDGWSLHLKSVESPRRISEVYEMLTGKRIRNAG